MAIQQIRLKLTGVSGLMMNSERGVDPLDEKVKELSKLTKKEKTDENHEKKYQLQWEIGIYHDPKIGPYIPGKNIRATLIEGAKKFKKGSQFKGGGIFIEEVKVPLRYTGPRDQKTLWERGDFRDVRAVVLNGTKKVMKCRPLFPTPWHVEVVVDIDAAIVQEQHVLDAAVIAGRYVGIGDYRPARGGVFGRFTAEAELIKAKK